MIYLVYIMVDTTDLLSQIISKLDAQGREITAIRKEHGEKLDEQGREVKAVKGEVVAIRQEHGEKLDRLQDGQNRQHTAMKVLQGTIEETKAEVDKLLHRPRQAD